MSLPTPFNFIFEYFPFIAFSVSLVNLWWMRNKTTSSIKKLLLALACLWLLWGILQIIGGYKTFFFVLLPPMQHPLVIIFWLLYFSYLWSVTAWVIWKNGAEDLQQLQSSSNKTYSPKIIKGQFIAINIISPLLLIAGHTLGLFNEMLRGIEQFTR